MSDDKLASLHEVLKDPVRQKILLKLGEHDRLSFDDLMKQLKIESPKELNQHLKVLDDLITKTVDDEYSLTENGASRKAGGQYMLTEKGHDALGEMLAFPEIKSENYQQIVNKKFFSKRAFARHKLFYVVIGTVLGCCVSFLGGIFLSIISVGLFGGPGVGRFGIGWDFFVTLVLISTLIGGLGGYLIGKRKQFKRPTPEWND
jgi:DNA-binding HxlR family transcriptional regulator